MTTDTTKKKNAQSAYQVGQVAASLLQKNGKCASGALRNLFGNSPTTPAGRDLFKAAPQIPQSEQSEAPEVKVEDGRQPKRRKAAKGKSQAEQKLENRELSLQNADEAERAPANRKRRDAGEAGLEKGAEHWVLKRQRRRQEKQDERSKNRRTAFVGNLPVGCGKKTLLGVFKADGAIESIRFRSMVREDPAVSRRVAAIKRQAHPSAQSINAYVVFEEPQGVAKALQRNGVEIQKDFIIRVDRVSAKAAQSHDHKRSVFVGNLNFELKELPLRRHFEECGAVEAVRLVRDHNTGLGKGFGYVLFQSGDSVQLALKLDGSKLEGRAVRVKRSAPPRTATPSHKGKAQRQLKHFKGEMAQPAPKSKKKTSKKTGKKKGHK